MALLGTSNTAVGPFFLPFDLTAIGMSGCTLYTSLDLTVPMVNQGGSATWTLPVPNVPALAGAKFYDQAVVFDPLANPAGLITSNAQSGTVGVK